MSDDKNKGGLGNFGAAAVGAAVGAAAGAAAVILSDEEKRKQITKAAQNAVKVGEKKFEQVKDKAADLVEEGKEELAGKLEDVAKKLEE